MRHTHDMFAQFLWVGLSHAKPNVALLGFATLTANLHNEGTSDLLISDAEPQRRKDFL